MAQPKDSQSRVEQPHEGIGRDDEVQRSPATVQVDTAIQICIPQPTRR
jgi:hypothetical protein